MYSLWSGSFEPNKENKKTPKAIISEQCFLLDELTKGVVIARIASYDVGNGDVFGFPMIRPKGTKIQQLLGDSYTENCFIYEFFLTSKGTPKYRYRVFFIRHGITIYPVEIFLDSSIETEIHDVLAPFWSNPDIIICKNEVDFIAVLQRILNSSKLEKVINSLLAMNERSAG